MLTCRSQTLSPELPVLGGTDPYDQSGLGLPQPPIDRGWVAYAEVARKRGCIVAKSRSAFAAAACSRPQTRLPGGVYAPAF